MKTINKKETARRFNVTPAMVTKYIRQGMPVTSTGRVNWAAAQRWRADNITSSRSGNFEARRRRTQNAQPGEPLRNPVPPPAPHWHPCRTLLDRILSRRHLVGPILGELGIRDPALLDAAPDLFAGLIQAFAGEAWDSAYPDGDDIPIVSMDRDGLSASFGLEFSPETVEEADRIADDLFEVALNLILRERQ